MRTISEVLPFMLWNSEVIIILLRLYIKNDVFEFVIVARGTAEIMLHGHTPAPRTILKLRVLRRIYVFTVVVKEKNEKKIKGPKFN
jgi:hypothetical protein